MAREQAHVLQDRSNRDIEGACRAPMQVECGFDDLEGPGMHLDRTRAGLGVEAANVACLIMKAHESVHRGNSAECRLHGRMHRRGSSPCSRDFHERTKQWPRLAHAI